MSGSEEGGWKRAARAAPRQPPILLGTSVHKIGESRQFNRSHLPPCLHEKTNKAGNARTSSQYSMNMLTPISSTKQRRNLFSSFVEENKAGNATTPSHLDTTILFRRRGFTCPLQTRFPRFMLPFGSDDAIHPAREWQSPGSADLVEEPKASAGPESVAGSLDVAELDCST